MYIQDVFKKVW